MSQTTNKNKLKHLIGSTRSSLCRSFRSDTHPDRISPTYKIRSRSDSSYFGYSPKKETTKLLAGYSSLDSFKLQIELGRRQINNVVNLRKICEDGTFKKTTVTSNTIRLEHRTKDITITYKKTKNGTLIVTCSSGRYIKTFTFSIPLLKQEINKLNNKNQAEDYDLDALLKKSYLLTEKELKNTALNISVTFGLKTTGSQDFNKNKSKHFKLTKKSYLLTEKEIKNTALNISAEFGLKTTGSQDFNKNTQKTFFKDSLDSTLLDKHQSKGVNTKIIDNNSKFPQSPKVPNKPYNQSIESLNLKLPVVNAGGEVLKKIDNLSSIIDLSIPINYKQSKDDTKEIDSTSNNKQDIKIPSNHQELNKDIVSSTSSLIADSKREEQASKTQQEEVTRLLAELFTLDKKQQNFYCLAQALEEALIANKGTSKPQFNELLGALKATTPKDQNGFTQQSHKIISKSGIYYNIHCLEKDGQYAFFLEKDGKFYDNCCRAGTVEDFKKQLSHRAERQKILNSTFILGSTITTVRKVFDEPVFNNVTPLQNNKVDVSKSTIESGNGIKIYTLHFGTESHKIAQIDNKLYDSRGLVLEQSMDEIIRQYQDKILKKRQEQAGKIMNQQVTINKVSRKIGDLMIDLNNNKVVDGLRFKKDDLSSNQNITYYTAPYLDSPYTIVYLEKDNQKLFFLTKNGIYYDSTGWPRHFKDLTKELDTKVHVAKTQKEQLVPITLSQPKGKIPEPNDTPDAKLTTISRSEERDKILQANFTVEYNDTKLVRSFTDALKDVTGFLPEYVKSQNSSRHRLLTLQVRSNEDVLGAPVFTFSALYKGQEFLVFLKSDSGLFYDTEGNITKYEDLTKELDTKVAAREKRATLDPQDSLTLSYIQNILKYKQGATAVKELKNGETFTFEKAKDETLIVTYSFGSDRKTYALSIPLLEKKILAEAGLTLDLNTLKECSTEALINNGYSVFSDNKIARLPNQPSEFSNIEQYNNQQPIINISSLPSGDSKSVNFISQQKDNFHKLPQKKESQTNPNLLLM